MRFKYLALILLLASCTFETRLEVRNPPVFIKYADKVFRGELGHTVLPEEKIEFLGHNIAIGDSVVSELEINITEVAKVPFDNELPNLGKIIGIAAKTVLVDTNQYQRYKINFIGNGTQPNGMEKNEASVVIYAKNIESTPLNSSRFKPGLLKR